MTTLIAETLLRRQPLSIRQQLERSTEFGLEVGLAPSLVMTLGEGGHIRPADLFSTARAVLLDGQSRRVSSLEETPEAEYELRKQDGALLLRVPFESGRFEVLCQPALTLLSEAKEARVAAARAILAIVGPTTEEWDLLERGTVERPLTDEELLRVLQVVPSGVEAYRSRLRSRLGGNTTVWDLAPIDRSYYRQLCGEEFTDLDPERYVRDVGIPYRKRLLERELSRGLEICLLGALRDDLCPGAWLQSQSHDAVWDALTPLLPLADPVGRVAVLDIALYRLDDARFRELALDISSQQTSPAPEEADYARAVVPILRRLTYSLLSRFDGGARIHPFWRRLCSGMQAALIARLSQDYPFDVQGLLAAAESTTTLATSYSSLVDLRREPRAWVVAHSEQVLAAELSCRYQAIVARHRAAGRSLPSPLAVAVEGGLDGDADVGTALPLPGILEVHLSPEREAETPAELRLVDQLRSVEAGEPLETEFLLGLVFKLGEPALAKIVTAVESQSASGSLDTFLGQLDLAARTAAAQRSTHLAEVVADKLCATVDRLLERRHLGAGVAILVECAASHPDSDDWEAWLEGKLSALASRVQPGEPARHLADLLRILQPLTRLEAGVVRKALALADAAY